jgi:hypothetical protein
MPTRRLWIALAAAALLATGVAAPLAGQGPESPVQVTTAVVATGVEDREPVGTAESFPADVGTVFFYIVLEGDFGDREIVHVWLHEGEEASRVTLNVRGPRWRTWSSKRIPSHMTGAWSVRVEDADATVLRTVEFTVE